MKPKDMTDEQLRIRVAELLGYQLVGELWIDPDGSNDPPPHYDWDLNACHEMEEGMSEADYYRYCDALWNLCRGASGKDGAIRATTRQRCEAFVEVMGQ